MNKCNAKHAYLIIAHSNFKQLQLLLQLLDDERNDIFIHIDAKAKNVDFQQFKVNHSRLIFIPRIRVNWGGYSLIKCELMLLAAAAPYHYQYYHLLSGADLPLKTQDEIHAFFSHEQNVGREYLSFDPHANETQSFLYRTHYYHPFIDLIGRNNRLHHRILRRLEHIIIKIQEDLHISRKDHIPLYKGTQWFSITDDLVQYILTQKRLIKKQFSYSLCGDEVFLHSIAMASPQKNNIVPTCLRAIDWKRGGPYTFRCEDVPFLLASPNFWGRKFDQNVDSDAIDMIVKHIRTST